MKNGTLIKVDRNGTKYYEGLVTCDRCSGRGLFIVAVVNGVGVPAQPDSGVCYKCGGSGKVAGKWKEYTDEYAAKLAAQREARAEKKRAELERKQQEEAAANSAAWLAKHGFAADGFTHVFLGDTYAAKEQLKEAGAKYDVCLGWHAASEVDGFYSIAVHVDEIAEKDAWGRYTINASVDEWDAKKKAAYKQLSGVVDMGYFGQVGEKVNIVVELVKSASYDYRFSKGWWGTETNYIYTLKDTEGHLFVWKTTSGLGRVENGEYRRIEEGERFTLKGTIKEHSEYKGEKQTVLTRCKVA